MMKVQLRKRKILIIIILLLAAISLAQSFVIANLYHKKDDKQYQVNLVKINTEKDSINYFKLKNDIQQIDEVARDLHHFLASKNIEDPNLDKLVKDSLNQAVYLAETSNRYSQYLVNLQKKLQQVPLGLPANGTISSNFGKRINPIPERKVIYASVGKLSDKNTDSTLTSEKKSANKDIEAKQIQFHKGLDIAVAYGTDVHCAAAGTVIFSGVKSGYGNCIIVSHGNGLDTLYAHLSQLLVKANDKVEVNQIIAKSGNTGRSTGPHLHYEVHKNKTPINPRLFLNL